MFDRPLPPDLLHPSLLVREPSLWPCVFAALVALAIIGFALWSRRQYLKLPVLPLAPASGDLPTVSIIIPARNEEAVIERCVRSFSDEIEVLVVDDSSSDETARRAVSAGAQVLAAPAPPRGWLGKPNACWTGARQASARWLLFVDADTWYLPHFLPSLLEYAQQHKLDAATVFPRQVCLTWAERLILPYAFGLYFCGVRAAAVNNPHSPEALANGQCLLIRREAYDFIHGHSAVAGSAVEDVALARLMKRHQMRLRVLRAETMARVRMYTDFGGLWRGLEKNSFRFLLLNPRTGVLVVLASVAMTSWAPLLIWLGVEGWILPAILFALIPFLAGAAWYGSWLRAWRAPLAIYLFQLIAVTAMGKRLFGLRTLWKGRPV